MFRRGGALGKISSRGYIKRLGALFGSSIVALWPQNEASGTVSRDISGHNYNGTYTGVTLGAQGIGDGNTAASYDGTTSFNNVYSAGLAAAFNGAEGTLLAWVKVSGAGVWTDAANRYITILRADANNSISLLKTTTNTRLQWVYTAGATVKSVTLNTSSPLTFFQVGLTWSAAGDAVKAFFGGTQTGSTQTTLGVWAGSLAATTSLIGASSTVPANIWSGSIGPAILLNRAATAAEIAQAATV